MNLSKALQTEFEAKYADFIESLSVHKMELPRDEKLAASLPLVFSLSDFVARSCIRRPQVLADLVLTGDLFRRYSIDDYGLKIKKALSGAENETELKAVLRLFRKREMIRTAWRDLSGWAGLEETVRDLSLFADSCIACALDFLYRRQAAELGAPLDHCGRPLQMIVVGMGKLGAMELNFSSDVDLVFAYPEEDPDEGRSISTEDFFTRLSRRLIHVLSASSADGNLFRVDMRLRPYGDNGPLVMSLDNMETYYQIQGREWERFAWVRARCIAGDEASGKKLMEKIRPFVYRRYLDYTVLEALREMKARINREAERKKVALNVKLGTGGIREIEFFCQMFQILRGGVTPVLQGAGTLAVLKLLADENYILSRVRDELTNVYEFLRTVEHRLQEFSDTRVHSIPSDSPTRERLAFSMGFTDFSSFLIALNRQMQIAHDHVDQLLKPDENKSEDPLHQKLAAVWQDADPAEEAVSVLRSCGYSRPEMVLSALSDLKDASETRALSPKGRQRVDLLIPLVLAQAGPSADAEIVLLRIIDLIKVIERRTSYIALLLENQMVLPHLIRLAGAGPWIISFLSRHPALLDELIDPRTLYSPPEKKELAEEIQRQLKSVSPDDGEEQIETLCIFKQTNILRVAAADVTRILPIMKVSDHLTEIAETVLESVLDLAWKGLVKKHGSPSGFSDPFSSGSGFLVVGYGKLGGIELGYHSDLDLVFLHSRKEGKTDGPAPLENSWFYARLGQRMVQFLTAHTRAGVLYETDTRLRPSGNSGPLVISLDGFLDYQLNKAWAWEHQALIRARAICGDPELADHFDAIRRKVLSLPRDPEPLAADIRSMRNRIRQERLGSDPDRFDLKESPGGIIDIEFLVQFLILAHACRHENLLRWTDNIRLLDSLHQNGIIDAGAAETLKNAYLTLRSAIHKANLEEAPPIVPSGRFEYIKADVVEIWKAFLK